jgi:gas vesicle protein
MGFIRGVITGLVVAAGAAAWYMSRAGQEFRDRYRVDRKLGEFGDEIEERTRDVRAKAGAQVAEIRTQAEAQVAEMRSQMSGNGTSEAVADTLDDAQAAAAEEAAEIAADVEAKAAKVKKAAKDEASSASE